MLAAPVRPHDDGGPGSANPRDPAAGKHQRNRNRKDTSDAAGSSEPLPAYFGPKKRLAVSELENKVTTNSATLTTPSGAQATSGTNIGSQPTGDFGTGLTEMLTTALVNSNRFIVLERKSLKDVQDEHTLSKTDSVDPTTALKAGTLLGAQAIVRGAITEYSFSKSSTNTGGIFGKILSGSTSSSVAVVALDIRIYDAATGQILDSVRAEGKAKARGSDLNIAVGDLKVGTSAFASSPLGQAVREAIEKAVKFICGRMERTPWESRVADIETEGDKVNSIYIADGSKEGLKIGDEFEVLHPGKTIVHPQTRVILGRSPDKLAGKCRITVIMPDYAIAVPIDGSGFARDDVVRMAPPSVLGQPARP
jgi:curli biogenesis system outer membrane secretion channel CsgG